MKTWKLWSLGIFWITAASCGGTSNLLSALKVCRVGVEATCGPGKQCVPSGELGEGVCQPVGFALCTHAQVSCGAKCCNNTTEFCDEESNTCQSKICGVGQRVCGTQCCQALPLTLTGFSPSEGGYDTLLSLQGTGFSTLPSENSVTLGKIQIPAAHILSATPTQLEVKVPKNTLCSGLIQVTVGDKTTTSSTPFAYLLTATVSTLAGNSAYGHVEATGELAQFRLPEGMSIDAQGTLYVADNENHRIRKVTPGGGVSTLAGGAIGATGAAGFTNAKGEAAQFNSPRGIALGTSGTLYVADSGNHCIRVVTSGGRVNTLAGGAEGATGAEGFVDGRGVEARFRSPSGIALGTAGTLYVADTGNHCIRKVSLGIEASVDTVAGHCGENPALADGTEDAHFYSPVGIAIDAAGTLYVADSGNHCIRKVTPGGQVTTLVGNGVAGFVNGRGVEARFHSPHGIALGTAGTLYVADSDNHCIRRVDLETLEVTTFAGLCEAPEPQTFVNGAVTVARFHFPHSISVDTSSDTLYVSDSKNRRIRKIAWE